MKLKALEITAVLVAVLSGPGLVLAQDEEPVIPDEGAPDRAEEINSRQIEEDIADAQLLGDQTKYGIGLRLRFLTLPSFIIDQFVDASTGGISSPGFGIDFVRRRGTFELTVGLEYESLNGTDGFWLEKGDDGVTPGQFPDFLEFDGLGWITLDANFVFLKPLGNSKFSLRYGGGFGLGIILGQVLKTDSICTGTNFNGGDCMKDPNAQEANNPADIPPVFPVINVLLGAQFRPTPQVVINAEFGLRTAPFIGLSGQYLF